MKTLSYKIYTLGCKVNQYDSNKLSSFMSNFNLKEVYKNADLALINTCSVTQKAISKNQRTINKAKKENPNAKIIVLGCWPRVYKNIKNENTDFVSGEKSEKKIVNSIIKELNLDLKKENDFHGVRSTDKSRYFIKVQDGCRQFCSYCIIPYTRGDLKSRDIDDILDEVENATEEGFREIVLSGIHLGLYGKDNVGNIDLARLIKKLVKVKKLKKIRLSSIELNEVNDEIVSLIANEKKICKHLHIPLQAGDDKILKAMNRPYNTDKFAKKVKFIRKKIPNIAITTDVIVGFPGETDELFKNTYRICKKINFSKIHVFSFSAHPITPAYKMQDKNDVETIKTRSKILRNLSKDLEENFKKKFNSKKVSVIIEKVGIKIKGKSEFYFDLEFYHGDVVDGSNLIKEKEEVVVNLVNNE